MKKSILIEVCTGLIVLLFSYTAIAKALGYHVFVSQLSQSPLSEMRYIALFVGWLLPLVEMAIVLGLLIEKTRTKAFYSAAILLSIFEIYITAMLVSGLHLPCSCGGIISKMSWKQHLIFNGIFIAIALLPILLKQKYKGSTDGSERQPDKGLSRAETR